MVKEGERQQQMRDEMQKLKTELNDKQAYIIAITQENEQYQANIVRHKEESFE